MADEKLKLLDRVLDEYADAPGPLVQVLHRAQDVYGYLPSGVQLRIADRLEIPRSTVRGVVSFYSFFRTEPRGQHMISICTGTACHVKGAERIGDMIQEALGIVPGETSEDGKFTLQEVRCIGACGLAPVMMIDEEVYGKLDRKKVEETLDQYRNA